MKTFVYLTGVVMFIFAIGSCDEGLVDASQMAEPGKGGSLARFTISGDYLYAVDENSLHCFNISDVLDPHYVSEKNVGFGIETIFPRDNYLFLGTQFGMHILDISAPAYPEKVSFFEHIYSCDPVVVDETYAYVTLSANNWCGRNTNELQIVNIEDLKKPFLVSSWPMKRPQGLGIDSTTLYVCDNGLQVFDVSDVNNIREIIRFDIDARDVIPYKGRLFVIGKSGIYQYTAENKSINLLSTIPVSR